MWETLLWLLVGAVLGFLSTWFLSNRSHNWELEEKKRERECNAREIRLREGEEIITEHSREFYYFERLCKLLLYVKSPIELITMSEAFTASYIKSMEEVDKGITINETSVNSLNDCVFRSMPTSDSD